MIYGWQRYLGMEKDFLEAEFYVSLDQSEVYSEFFTREIILLGAEIDSAFKELCRRLDGTMPNNIGDYRRIILAHLPNIIKVSVCTKGTPYGPFEGWDTGPLQWWRVYSKMKHNIVDNEATLGVAMAMLQAYQLLLFCITAVSEDVRLNLIDMPKLVEVKLPGNAGAVYPDMQVVRVYPRKDVLNTLGYDSSKQ